jgi:hypothetical protein
MTIALFAFICKTHFAMKRLIPMALLRGWREHLLVPFIGQHRLAGRGPLGEQAVLRYAIPANAGKHQARANARASHATKPIPTIASLLSLSVFASAQSEFVEKSKKLEKENELKLKQSLKAFKVIEFKVNDLKQLIRKNKSAPKPVEFTLSVDEKKFKFSIFENDITTDDYVAYLDGKLYKKKEEIDTYAGYVNDHPKNALRLYITDNRISGFFRTNEGEYIIGHVADFGILEKPGNSDKKLIYLTKSEDEISNADNGVCLNQDKLLKGGRLNSANYCQGYSDSHLKCI